MSELRDEQRERRRLRPGPIIAVLAVLVLVLLGVVGVLGANALFGGDDEPPPEGQQTSSSAPASQKPVVREDLNVVAGEGGSTASEIDPSLPVGYEPTCKGAVQAATNYLIGLDYTKVTSGEMSKEDYFALVKDRTTGDYQSTRVEGTREFFDRVGDAEAPRASILPDWGGFTLIECEEGASAKVGIVYAVDNYGSGEYYYASYSTSLKWVEGDWKMSGDGSVESPTALPEEPVTEPDDEVSTLVGTHTQWENYEPAS